jgi:ribose transport system substrate-binding protein
MRIRMLITALLLVLVTAGYYGFAQLPFTTGAAHENKIIVILKTDDIRMDFWQTVSAGVQAAAKQFGAQIDIRGPLRETDTDKQIELVEQAIRDKPEAIVLAPTDVKRLVPIVQKVRHAGVRLVVIDTPLGSDAPQAFISNDHLEAGRKAGETLVKETGGHPVFAVINDSKSSSTGMDRLKGVLQALSDTSAVNLGTFYCYGLEESAYQTVKALIQTNPNLNGIFGLNETAALGAAKAIKEQDKSGQITLIGFDGSIYEIKLLEEGVLDATVVQRPFNMGFLSVQTAVQLIKGKKTEKTMYLDSIVVGKNNMYSQENQKLLFPFVQK